MTMNRRTFLKTAAVVGSSITLSTGLTGCLTQSDDDDDSSVTSMRFAILSDLHTYDTSLGTSGTAFEEYLAGDRKMLVESTEILQAMVDNLLEETDLDAVIIPGDLSKDGELLCHQKTIEILQSLRDNGILVYVVPGNHDINNPDAVSFDGDSTTSVDTVTADEFAELYDDFGYGSALYQDENSLSYIVEPVEGVWLVALDSCKYDDNLTNGSPDTSGELTDDQLGWLQPLLETAQEEGKVVFGMMHHGIVAHFDSQPDFFSEYLIDEYESVGELLASYGLNLIFTGHFHAQDAVSADYNGDGSSMMYDVETGSVVTSPCPYRFVDLDIANATFSISSEVIDSISSMSDFATYKEEFIEKGMVNLYTSYLAAYVSDETTLSYLANLAATLHIAHYKGDEDTDETTLATLESLMASEDTTTAYLGSALYSLAVDPGLADNELSVEPDSQSVAMVSLFRRLMLA